MAKWKALAIVFMVVCSPCILCGYLTCACLGPSGTRGHRKRQERQEARLRRKSTAKGKAITVLLFIKDIPRYICGCIICCPCTLCELEWSDSAEKRKKARVNNEPVALPARERELSVVSGNGYQEKRLVSWLPFGIERKEPKVPTGVVVSLLLQLPFEIRQKIIEDVLGNNILHLMQLPKRLGHIRCWDSNTASRHQDLARNCIHPPREFYRGCNISENTTSDGCLALLKTCRQLYLESIKVLYETNTFDVNHAQTLSFLQRTIIPRRLESIRYLQISWKGAIHRVFNGSENERYGVHIYPDSFKIWNTIWDIVGSKMTGLRSLKVRFLIVDRSLEPVAAATMHKMLDGLREKVKGLQYFGLEIPGADWVDDLEKSVEAVVCTPR